MNAFEGITFQGTFRPYQQRVLDNSKEYLKNNKIHIVAAPGSGKTILGLELIRRLGSPCLVLSPTNTIRYQWGDRFESMFLTPDKKVDDFVSFDLNNLKPITSTTYQALHSAMEKISFKDEDGQEFDYSEIDMFKLVKENGIKTICVDEAHHLQNEWQKALEKFISGLGGKVKVVALTATPPYDASSTEWDRYIKICGQIDEEIFVTELVQAKNLCPHQDYIYLNYPTDEELLPFKEHHDKLNNVLSSLASYRPLNKLSTRILHCRTEDSLIENRENYIAVFSLLKSLDIKFDEKRANKLLHTKDWKGGIEVFEKALNFLLGEKTILPEEDKKQILSLLRKEKLVEKGNAKLCFGDKLNKVLTLSLGKLDSIKKIAKCECDNQKENLRMLILTDYIRQNTKGKIGTNLVFSEISIVSIFESLRRENLSAKLGILSGTFAVFHSSLEDKIRTLLGDKGHRLSCKPLGQTGYSEYIFGVSNKEKVKIITQIFEEGDINILVGTKALLGEGWDSPCINSLILASFVGSFMLSNQMRGRAIRVYKNDPNKTANIWHLVTLEPNSESVSLVKNIETPLNEETSSDYRTLQRRFECFVGPHYERNTIEGGISRISILKDSYTPLSAEQVNKEMEKRACDRDAMAKKWFISTTKSGQMYVQTIIPKEHTPKGTAWFSLPVACVLATLFSLCLHWALLQAKEDWLYITFMVITCLLGIGVAFYLYKISISIFSRLFLRMGSRAIMRTLKEVELLASKSKIKINYYRKEKSFGITFINTNSKEQKLFSKSLKEMFSPIAEPRYLLRKTFFKKAISRYCLQVPAELAKNKSFVYLLKFFMFMFKGFEVLYCKGTKEEKLSALRCQAKCFNRVYFRPITEKQILS